MKVELLDRKTLAENSALYVQVNELLERLKASIREDLNEDPDPTRFRGVYDVESHRADEQHEASSCS